MDYLLLRAIQLGASDLHIEPMQTKVRVRVRIDGVLQSLTEFRTQRHTLLDELSGSHELLKSGIEHPMETYLAPSIAEDVSA